MNVAAASLLLATGALLLCSCDRQSSAAGALEAQRAEAPASSRLAALPEGEERRRFILDCTGCHTFRSDLAYPDGSARTVEAWEAAAERMLAQFGPSSGFPVIGAGRDAATTARWLARFLPAEPPPAVAIPTALLGSANLREYLLPESAELPHDLAVSGDRVVITGMFTDQLYILDPASGDIQVEPTPAPNPRAIEIDATGNWWVVLGAPERVARRSASGEWTTFPSGFYAHSVAVGTDGAVWVNGHFTHAPELIRRIEPATGRSQDFTVPDHPAFRTTTVPYEIRIAPDGALWMSELQGNRIVRLDTSGQFKTWTMPTTWSGPRRLDVDPHGVVWIPEYAANKLARFDPITEQFEEFELPINAAGPYVARFDRRRNAVWIGTGSADAVLRFDIATERFRVYPLLAPDQLVRHLDVDDATGDIWIAPGSAPGSVPARVVRLQPTDDLTDDDLNGS